MRLSCCLWQRRLQGLWLIFSDVKPLFQSSIWKGTSERTFGSSLGLFSSARLQRGGEGIVKSTAGDPLLWLLHLLWVSRVCYKCDHWTVWCQMTQYKYKLQVLLLSAFSFSPLSSNLWHRSIKYFHTNRPTSSEISPRVHCLLEYILLIRGLCVVRLPPIGPLLLVFRGGWGAMQAAAGVFPPRLLPLWGVTLLMLAGSSLHIALHIGVGHQVDVTVRVTFKAHQHHTWEDGAKHRKDVGNY